MVRIEVPRFAVLFSGIVLLIFTFVNAYLFLNEDLMIVASSSLIDLFGESLAPLVEACIRVMYLAIMGWIGSIVTIRGVQLLTPYNEKAKSDIVQKVEAKTRKSRTENKLKGKEER